MVCVLSPRSHLSWTSNSVLGSGGEIMECLQSSGGQAALSWSLTVPYLISDLFSTQYTPISAFLSCQHCMSNNYTILCSLLQRLASLVLHALFLPLCVSLFCFFFSPWRLCRFRLCAWVMHVFEKLCVFACGCVEYAACQGCMVFVVCCRAGGWLIVFTVPTDSVCSSAAPLQQLARLRLAFTEPPTNKGHTHLSLPSLGLLHQHKVSLSH